MTDDAIPVLKLQVFLSPTLDGCGKLTASLDIYGLRGATAEQAGTMMGIAFVTIEKSVNTIKTGLDPSRLDGFEKGFHLAIKKHQMHKETPVV